MTGGKPQGKVTEAMGLQERAEIADLNLTLINPESPLKYSIQYWLQEKNQEPLFLVKIPHNSFACNPDDDCSGQVIVSFEKHCRGFKSCLCRGCEEQVEVDLVKLQIGLNIW
ncbi:MAG: hypothetical protein M1142_04150 [Patescibacteria group bacterium]|nr:hypothetical protein [Patescibacteria group bacterium]